jgi:hypothetical protein
MWIFPAFQGVLPCADLQSYTVLVKRLQCNLVAGGAAQDLYPFVPDDLVYYRTTSVKHLLDLEWKRSTKSGSPPWFFNASLNDAMKKRFAALRCWTPAGGAMTVMAPPWPAAQAYSLMSSVFAPPAVLPNATSVLGQLITAHAGSLCVHCISNLTVN